MNSKLNSVYIVSTNVFIKTTVNTVLLCLLTLKKISTFWHVIGTYANRSNKKVEMVNLYKMNISNMQEMIIKKCGFYLFSLKKAFFSSTYLAIRQTYDGIQD